MHSYSQLKEAMSSISMKRSQGMTSHILYMEKDIDKPTFEKATKAISQELSKSFKGLTDPKQFVHGVSAWNNGKPYYQVTVDTTKSEYSPKTDTKVITILGDVGDSALDGKFMISTRKNMLPESEESIEESLFGIASYAQEQRETLIKTLKPGDKVSTRKMKMEGTFIKIATEGGLEKVYFKVADGRVMKTPIENILRGSLKEDEESLQEAKKMSWKNKPKKEWIQDLKKTHNPMGLIIDRIDFNDAAPGFVQAYKGKRLIGYYDEDYKLAVIYEGQENEEFVFESTDPIEMYKEIGYKVVRGPGSSKGTENTVMQYGKHKVVIDDKSITYIGSGEGAQGKKALSIANRTGRKFIKY